MVYECHSGTTPRKGRGASSSNSTAANVRLSGAGCHPVWNRINQGEIDARVEVLAAQLRHDRAQSLRQKVGDLRRNALCGLRPYAAVATPDLVQRATLGADLDFLRRFLRGVCDVFVEYLERMQLGLGPRDIAEMWTGGIEPRWKLQVQLAVARWKR
jgi:hypothetical protein